MLRAPPVSKLGGMLVSHALRPSRSTALALLVVGAALLLGAVPARAGLSTWTPMPGLGAANGTSWVRDYEFSLPATVYAATEGAGVYRIGPGDLAWQPFNDGLMDVPGARDVRTVHVDGGRVLAGTTAGLFVSEGGAFSPLAQGPEPDPSNPIRLPRAVQKLFRQGGVLLAGTQSGGVYRSGDDGATWIKPAPGNGMPSSATVWDLDALIPGIVFAATSDGVFRSADSGATWSPASDGVAGTVMRVFKDPVNPNVFYAGTTSGVYRSVDLGLSWTSINGVGSGGLGDTTVRGMEPFVNGVDTRLYTATADGLWVGTTGNGPLPGPVRWRAVTQRGLAVGGSPNDVFWAIATHTLPTGTLLAGTQSNGGYALTFEPPYATAAPILSTTTPRAGVRVTTTNGTWRGTPSIEHAYQWQRCTSDQPASCTNIPGATDADYVPAAFDQASPAKRLRVLVTGENDFPTLGLVNVASAISSPVAANPDPARTPGAGQMAAPAIGADAPADATLPQVGDVLRAGPGFFNPLARTRDWTWYRCDGAGAGCLRVVGHGSAALLLKEEDVGRRFRVAVTGTNDDGSGTTPLGGPTNVVFPADPVNEEPPAVLGVAQVGETLVGTTGGWRSGGNWRRRWLRCDAVGDGCQTIGGQTGATLVPTAEEVGRTLRVEVTADPNGPSTFPSAASALSSPSAVVTLPPAPPGGGGGGGDGGGGAGGGGGGGSEQPRPPARDTVKPVLRGTKAAAARVRSGAPIVLRFRASEAGRVAVKVERLRDGRRKGRRCVAGLRRGRGRRCTAAVRVRTFGATVAAGPGRVTVQTRAGRSALALGRYRVTVTPVDAAGNRGAARVVAVALVPARRARRR